MNGVKLNVISPKKLSASNISIVEYLELDPSKAVLLKYRKAHTFISEPNNCHLNIMVQCDKNGGQAVEGWIIGQDIRNNFLEARFHSVWLSPEGELIDFTPRTDLEKRIMFLPDPKRKIMLTTHNNIPAIMSYDSVKLINGVVQSVIKQIICIPQSDMIYKYGLADRS
ncbi:hypothetical protein [Shewanella polaris]|uniref:Uncharacterized protein n=1 Tax=Shewanella polaris TaxID=2588449 RepID=A0A4Y5YIR0_9GAMM|nr:hypothetical protein [Shewanella polaris]QDE32399.1 hypothetical protein FH971_16365 [Shewanella polaris]